MSVCIVEGLKQKYNDIGKKYKNKAALIISTRYNIPCHLLFVYQTDTSGIAAIGGHHTKERTASCGKTNSETTRSDGTVNETAMIKLNASSEVFCLLSDGGANRITVVRGLETRERDGS